MLEHVFILPMVALLCYGSYVDYKHRIVEHWLWVLVVIIGLLYSIYFYNLIIMISLLFFTIVIWGLPVLFTLGMGDLMLLIGINLFFNTVEELFMFSILLVFVWAGWTIFFKLWKKIKIDRKNFFKYEYPLVPAIAITYTIWFVGGPIFVW